MALARSRVRLTSEPPMLPSDHLAFADAVIDDLDAIVTRHHPRESGLPTYDAATTDLMRAAVLRLFREHLQKVLLDADALKEAR